MSTIVIRPAEPDDAEAIGRIRVAAWQAAYAPFLPASFLAQLDPTANLPALRERLSTPSSQFLVHVAVLDRNVMGFSIAGTPRYTAATSTQELWALNVDPAAWRQGAGKQLVMAAISAAIRTQHHQLALWCLTGNTAAIKLYLASGFAPTGQTRTTSDLTGHPLHETYFQIPLSI